MKQIPEERLSEFLNRLKDRRIHLDYRLKLYRELRPIKHCAVGVAILFSGFTVSVNIADVSRSLAMLIAFLSLAGVAGLISRFDVQSQAEKRIEEELKQIEATQKKVSGAVSRSSISEDKSVRGDRQSGRDGEGRRAG